MLQVATALHAYFSTIYAQHIVHVPGEAVPAGTIAIQFIVAGYDQGLRVGELFECNVPGAPPVAAARTSNNAGPWWIGQNDVAGRVYNGFDGRIISLPFVHHSTLWHSDGARGRAWGRRADRRGRGSAGWTGPLDRSEGAAPVAVCA